MLLCCSFGGDVHWTEEVGFGGEVHLESERDGNERDFDLKLCEIYSITKNKGKS